MKVSPISFCNATQHSQNLCQSINLLYKLGYTTQEIADQLNIGKTAVRYYYYGVHNCPEAHFHWKNAFEANKNLGHIQHSLNQVRIGTCVPI